MDVLVEGKNEKLEGYLSGRLSNNMLVHFKGDEDLIGKIIDVHIDESKGFYYFGTIVLTGGCYVISNDATLC